MEESCRRFVHQKFSQWKGLGVRLTFTLSLGKEASMEPLKGLICVTQNSGDSTLIIDSALEYKGQKFSKKPMTVPHKETEWFQISARLREC